MNGQLKITKWKLIPGPIRLNKKLKSGCCIKTYASTSGDKKNTTHVRLLSDYISNNSDINITQQVNKIKVYSDI